MMLTIPDVFVVIQILYPLQTVPSYFGNAVFVFQPGQSDAGISFRPGFGRPNGLTALRTPAPVGDVEIRPVSNSGVFDFWGG